MPSQDWGETAKLAAEIRDKSPCATLDQIAETISERTGKPKVSRQAIHLYLDRAKKQTAGASFGKRTLRTCNSCGEEFRIGSDRPGLFCSKECWSDYHKADLVCGYCGKEFKRPYSDVRAWAKRGIQEGPFCSRECQGKWLGEEHGLGVYPEHSITATPEGLAKLMLAKREAEARKRDQFTEFKNQGLTYKEISDRLGIDINSARSRSWRLGLAKKRDPDLGDKILELRSEGDTYRDISDKLGISQVHACKVAAKLGLTRPSSLGSSLDEIT